MLKCSNLSEVTIHGIQSEPVSNVISAMQAQRFLIKGCEAFFFSMVLNSKRGQVKLEDILVIKKFPDVFPEELPGLPPKRELDLGTEFLPRTNPISRAPYLMAPTELKELRLNFRSYWTRDSSDLVFYLGCAAFVYQKEIWHSPDVHRLSVNK